MHRRFKVSDDDCTGCGLCSERAPENFEPRTGDMIVRIKSQPQDEQQAADCEEAADYCPAGAIRNLEAGETRPDDSAAPKSPTRERLETNQDTRSS